MTRFPRRKRTLAALVLTVLALAAATVAIAAWIVIQSNSQGQGKVGSLLTPTVAAAAPWSGPGDLVPHTNPTGDLKLLVSNPNGSALNITTIDGTGSSFSIAGSCPQANLSFPAAIPPSQIQPNVIPAGAVNLPVLVTDAIRLAPSAPSACQGLDYTVSAFSTTFSTP